LSNINKSLLCWSHSWQSLKYNQKGLRRSRGSEHNGKKARQSKKIFCKSKKPQSCKNEQKIKSNSFLSECHGGKKQWNHQWGTPDGLSGGGGGNQGGSRVEKRKDGCESVEVRHT